MPSRWWAPCRASTCDSSMQSVCIWQCVHTYINAYIHAYINVRIHTSTYRYTLTHMHIHICTYIYTDHAYINIHTNVQWARIGLGHCGCWLKAWTSSNCKWELIYLIMSPLRSPFLKTDSINNTVSVWTSSNNSSSPYIASAGPCIMDSWQFRSSIHAYTHV